MATGDRLFQALEAFPEFGVGLGQSRLRIDPQVAAEVGDHKEEIPQLLSDGLPTRLADGGCELVAQLAQLLFDLLQDGRDIGPVEAHPSCLLRHPVCRQQRRQRVRHSGEQRLLGLGGLQLVSLPGLPNGCGVRQLLVAKYVWVTRDHLCLDSIDHVGERKGLCLVRKMGNEDNLKQQVAELSLQLAPI